jgi:HB1, ASXL, restriction endonuclease HTH domain
MDEMELFFRYEREVAEFKLQLIRRLARPTEPGETPRQKRTSNIQIVENVLAAAGRPLHVSEIIAAAQNDFGVVLERDSVSSALVKQIRKGTRFVRTAPNTFGLRPT